MVYGNIISVGLIKVSTEGLAFVMKVMKLHSLQRIFEI
jgi:hypothetical protein